MFNSLKSKIIVPSIGVLALLVVVIFAYTVVRVNYFANEITEQRLETAIQTTNAYLESLRERNRITSITISDNIDVVERLRDWNAGINPDENRRELINYLNSIKSDLGVDSFVIIGQDATVMLRTHMPHTFDDSVYGIPFFMSGLSGERVFSFTSTNELPMALSHLTPILDNGEVIGTLSASVVMSRNLFVDNFAKALNAQITIFAGTERVATTLLDDNGQREMGIHAQQDIIQAVIHENRYYTGNVTLRGIPFSAYYFPLHGWDGAVIGMFFAGFSNEHTNAITTNLQLTLIILAIVGLVIAAVLMFFLIMRSLKPLENLMVVVEDVTAGKLNVNIDKANLPKDEIGALTHNVCGLIDVINNIVYDFTNMHKEYVKLGNCHYNIDDSKYQNSFKEMVVLVNNLLTQITTDIFDVADVLYNISDGDFSKKLQEEIWVGDWIYMPKSLNNLTNNLKAISSEVDGMIKAAAIKGELRFQIDATHYSGDWKKIMNGLNDIAKAVDSPINEIMNVMDNISQGNFSALVVGDYNGDFLKIKNAVNTTIETLSAYIAEITEDLAAIAKGDLTTSIQRDYVGSFIAIKNSLNNISSTLNKTMSEIYSASSQVLAGAKQISASATDLATGAQEQASSVQELNATIDIISQQTRLNADNAVEASNLSNKSSVNAQEGNEAMQQMTTAMAQIKDSSNDISKIIKVIQEIAFQTNLLALNAAVEAARAGEQGRGFNVVAEEVRNLAARSQESATETTELIEDSISRVNSGSKIAEVTSQSLDTIVKNASGVLDIISNITISSKEQAEAITQVGKGLEQISRVVQSNSAASQETAAASQELNSQAELLQQLVSYFKLRNV